MRLRCRSGDAQSQVFATETVRISVASAHRFHPPMCSRRALPAAHNAVAAMLSFIVIRLSGKEPGLVERRVSSPALFPLAKKCGPPVHRPQTLLTDKAKKALKTTGRCGAEKKAPPSPAGFPYLQPDRSASSEQYGFRRRDRRGQSRLRRRIEPPISSLLTRSGSTPEIAVVFPGKEVPPGWTSLSFVISTNERRCVSGG